VLYLTFIVRYNHHTPSELNSKAYFSKRELITPKAQLIEPRSRRIPLSGRVGILKHGLRFFYRITLGWPEPHFYLPGARGPSKLPEVLSHEELVRLFTVATNRKQRHC